jgi:transglutaminase-like putative cysteine protease
VSRAFIAGFITVMLLISLFIQPPAAAYLSKQKAGNERSAILRYSIYLRSNYSSTRDITFVWTFRNTEWSRISLESSTPGVYSSAYLDCEGNEVPKDSFDAMHVYSWYYKGVPAYGSFQVDFKVKIDVSSFEPSTLTRSQVGTVEDALKYFSETEYAKYCNETFYWDYSSREVQEVIREINMTVNGSKNVYDIVQGTLWWFSTHMMYGYPYEFDYPEGRAKASQILNQSLLGRHYGVCRHFAYVFTAIMRGFGVPCVYESGRALMDVDGELRYIGGHAWCIVYLPPIGWHRVEVTISDRSTLDAVRVGLIPHPIYYVPEYVEYTNKERTPEDGTYYPYVITGGYIHEVSARKPVEEQPPINRYGAAFLILSAAAVAISVSIVFIYLKLRRIERMIAPTAPPTTICPRCGASRVPNAAFCVQCGYKFEF